MYISSLDLFEALKPSMGEANAKTLISKLEQQENVVDVKIEKVATILDLKIEKALDVHAKIYKDDIKGLKEFMVDKFATKEDLANSKSDSSRQNFLFWVSQITILAGLMIALFIKFK